MGILDFLFGKKEKEAVNQQPLPPENVRKDPVDEGFKSAKWVIREAFDKVMQSIEGIPVEKKEALFKAIQAAHRSGDPRKEEEAVIRHLSRTGWKWLEYEKWAEIFKQRQQWPQTWYGYGLAESDPLVIPESVSYAVGYFNVNELKEFLKARNIKVKPAPKTRADLERHFKEVVSWEEFKPLAVERYEELLEDEGCDKGDNLCKLLARELAANTYCLIHYYQGQDLIQDGLCKNHCWQVTGGIDPIEKEFEEKFNNGVIKDLPPYFPGDRNRLRLKIR